MGRAKQFQIEQQELESQALGFLVQTGILAECENHPGSVFDAGGAVEEAYPIANSMITKGEIELPDGVSRRDFTDAIKAAYENNSGPEHCYSCEKNMRD